MSLPDLFPSAPITLDDLALSFSGLAVLLIAVGLFAAHTKGKK